MESILEPTATYQTTLGLHIIPTEDLSDTLYSELYNETYHSRHGAVQEARHVFIKYGLLPLLERKNEISIFEMGMGTGLNVMVTLENPQAAKADIRYHGLEKHPLEFELIDQLNYRNNWDDIETKLLFSKLHQLPWDIEVQLTPLFHLKKINADFFDFPAMQESYDLIFQHAFAPVCQPELWSEPVISKFYAMLKPGGAMVTYAAQGQFKRDLKAAGFLVESLPGPSGKREMTRATKMIT